MTNTNSLDRVIPNDFPRTAYNGIIKRVYITVSEKRPTPLLDHFHDAWLAVAYRFFTFTEHDTAYRDSIRRAGSNAPRLEHYIQESALFGFFISGLTVIESFYYSCYSLAAMLDDKNFPMKTPKFIQPTSTADKFVKFYSGELLTGTLDRFRNDIEYKNWGKIRNILAHRILPARQVKVTIWPPQPNPLHEVSWTEDSIPLDLNTTASRREWLA